MTKIQETGDKVLANVERVIVGKHHEVRLALVALLCRGHLLIEDVPGTGKTVLAKAIARSLGCTFRRIQFTPDLLPSDVTGLSIYNQKTQEFEFRPGPIMSQVVLADEINRATPKTQSALLECMEERQATIDGTTYPMPDPFLVIATQNPIEYEGTFALPEAQLDRFMLRLRLGYPAAARGDRHPRRAEAHPSARGPRGGPAPSRSCARCRRRSARSTSTRRVADYIVRLVNAHPQPPRRLPRRLAARLDRAVPRRPGVGRPARPRLRHPRRRQGARRARPRPPADHQDELVDPRRPGRPGRPRAARDDRRRGHPTDRAGGPTGPAQPSRGRLSRLPAPRTGPSTAMRAPEPTAMFRRLQLLLVAVVLVVAAFSTGWPFLFYLVYLGDPRHRRLVRPDAPRACRPRGRLRGDQLHGHVGDRIRVTYTLRNTQPPAEALAGGPQPDDAAGRPAGPGDLARGRERALVARPRPARRAAATSGSSRSRSAPATRSASSRRRRRSARASRSSSTRGSSRCRCWRLPAGDRRGQPRVTRADPPDDAARDDRPAVGPGRRDTTGSTGRRPRATARSRSRSSTSSRPPTPGSSSTSSAASQAGGGDESTIEVGVRAAASVADKALAENRAVGMTVNAGRTAFLPADRGGRQHLKIMQLLAAVEADGSAPLVETLDHDRRGASGAA